jgi:hypothetical protein
VTAQREGAFDCQVGSKAEISKVDADVVGTQGIKQTIYDAGNGGEVSGYKNLDPSKIKNRLALNFDTFRDQADYTANVFKGWFTPPVTGRYRFYQACDDHCSLKIGMTPFGKPHVPPLEEGQTAELTKLLDIH